jgi:ElaB/YqjD/DUF883 family membrane-anchored ribosome-binding protein
VENTQLTPVEKTPEQIQNEMTQTRESLTGKVAALENQVVGTVQTAADTLTGTVESVKSLLTNAPGAVTDTVRHAADVVGEKMKQIFNISGHVRNHPWTSVGASTLLGCVTGWLISRGRDSRPAEATMAPVFAPPVAAPSKPGVLDEMFSMIGRKLREVAENAIDTATTAVNKNVREEVPKLVDAAAVRLTPGAV